MASSSLSRFISCSIVPWEAPKARRSLMIFACSFISFSINLERLFESRDGSRANAGKLLQVKCLVRFSNIFSCNTNSCLLSALTYLYSNAIEEAKKIIIFNIKIMVQISFKSGHSCAPNPPQRSPWAPRVCQGSAHRVSY